jgi:hypothetical protein
VDLNYLAADREADAGARILRARVQSLKDVENLPRVLALDADPVVADRDDLAFNAILGRDRDPWSDAGTHVLDAVADQMFE